MKRWLRYAGYLGLEACFVACLCSTGPAAGDYVPPPEEKLFAGASAIVDVTVTHVDDQKHVAVKLNEILRGRKCPPVLTGHVAGSIGRLGQHLKRAHRYVLILYGQDVHAYFPVRLSARGKREVQYEQTWISFEAFAKRLPVELAPNEKDPRKVLAALSESGGDAMARAHPSLKANKEFVRIAVRISGNTLRYASPAIRKDPQIVLSATRYNAQAWPYAHPDLWKDPTFVIRLRRAVPASDRILRNADPKLRDDRELVMQVVKVNGSELAFASQRLRKDRQVVQAAGFRGLPHADLRWRDDKPLVLSIMKRHGGWLGAASERLKADREVVLTAARSSGAALYYASPKLRSDREIILAAVTNNGSYLYLAAESLRGDREIVLAAVQSCGDALGFAAPKLRKDKQICLAAVRQKGGAIQRVDWEVPDYREIALAAVRQDGRVLDYLPLKFKSDRRIAMVAVSQHGSVLSRAPLEVRGDPDIVLAAAENRVTALGCAASRLLGDPEFMLTAAKQSSGALHYAIGRASLDSRIIALREDRPAILRAVRKGDPYALYGASNRLRSDPEFILQVISAGRAKTVPANPATLALWNTLLWDNPRFVLRAIEADPWILRSAPWRVRADRKYVLAAVAKEGLTFALADRTVRGDEAVAATALKSNPKLVDSFDRLARGGVQWGPKVRAAYEAALRRRRGGR